MAVSSVKLGITPRSGQLSRGGLATRNGEALLTFPASYGNSAIPYRNFWLDTKSSGWMFSLLCFKNFLPGALLGPALFIYFWLDTHLFHLYFLLKSIMVFRSSIKAQQGLPLLGAEPSWLQHWALGVRLQHSFSLPSLGKKLLVGAGL